jgi:polyferredoxin
MLICMVASVAFANKIGRYWCGWMCPRGSFFDYMMGRISRNRSAPSWMRSTAFRVGALVFLMGMMSVQMALAWPDPQAIGRVFIVLLTATTLVGIGLALAYKPRTWCTVCPMGTMATWAAQGHNRALQVDDATCSNCSACSRLCPMELTPQQPDQARTACIKCELCITRCPRKALSFGPTEDSPILEQAA